MVEANRAANVAARSIVKLAEVDTSKELSLEACVGIVAIVGKAIEEACDSNSSASNAWRAVWNKWETHPGFRAVVESLAADGCFSAATAINKWIETMLKPIDEHNEMCAQIAESGAIYGHLVSQAPAEGIARRIRRLTETK